MKPGAVELDILHVSTFTGTCFTMAGTASIHSIEGMLNFDGTHVADITICYREKALSGGLKAKGIIAVFHMLITFCCV